MKIKAYLFLPDSDIAFENLHGNHEIYEDIIRDLNIVKQHLKKFDDYEICYDSGNISSFIAAANGVLDDKYLFNIQSQLQITIGNKSLNVNLPNLRNIHTIYANWNRNVSVSYSSFIISECVESYLKTIDGEKTVCICLGNPIDHDGDELHVIRDSNTLSDSPTIVTISTTNSSTNFVNWTTSITEKKFSLSKVD